jgi:ABC-type branched-subunit amino acid transport system substrate-binding protein
MFTVGVVLVTIGLLAGIIRLWSIGPSLNVRSVLTPVVVASLSFGIALTGLSATSAGASTKAHDVAPRLASVPGLTSHKITIGATAPLTGAASLGYDQVAEAANAVFNWVNTHGRVNGRKINFVIKNDCYDLGGIGCETTETATSQLLDMKGGLFATVGSLGTPTQDSVLDLVKSWHTPQLFVNSGAIDWDQGTKNPAVPRADRGAFPNLFGWQPSYVVESKILADYIKATFGPEKVCFLGEDDNFGTDGLLGLEDQGLNPAVELVGSSGYNPADLTESGYLTPFIQKLADAGCQVNYLDTIPQATALSLSAAQTLDYWTPHWVVSSAGSDPWTIAQYLGAEDDEYCTNLGETPPQPCNRLITFAALPATTVTRPWWSGIEHHVLMDDSYFTNSTAVADHYYVKSATTLNDNEIYGIGWGIAFVEALMAAGAHSFTQAQFVHILETTSFPSNALLKLDYKSGTYATGNHQGLLGGYVVQVLRNSETEPVSGPFDGKVYVSNNAKRGTGSGVTLAPAGELNTAGPPPWL